MKARDQEDRGPFAQARDHGHHGPFAQACLVLTAAVLAMTLQGCVVPRLDGYVDISRANIQMHHVPYWRQKPDYYEGSSYVDPVTGLPAFNSCMNLGLSPLSVCNRRGHCEPFDRDDITNTVLFCKCHDSWGGPECNIRRKSQTVAWFISMVLGPLAADELYLGHMDEALMKLLLSVAG